MVDSTAVTCRVSGRANVPSVKNEPVVGFKDQRFGNVSGELQLGFKRRLCSLSQTDPGSHPEDMCINSHGRLPKYDR